MFIEKKKKMKIIIYFFIIGTIFILFSLSEETKKGKRLFNIY